MIKLINYKDFSIFIDRGIFAIGIGINKDNDNNINIGLSILFIHLLFIIRTKEKRRKKLIKAKVDSNRNVRIIGKNYDEFYPFESEKPINDLKVIYRRNKFNKWDELTKFRHTDYGFIVKYSEGVLHNFEKTTILSSDDISLYKPDTFVQGYFKMGYFVVVD